MDIGIPVNKDIKTDGRVVRIGKDDSLIQPSLIDTLSDDLAEGRDVFDAAESSDVLFFDLYAFI